MKLALALMAVMLLLAGCGSSGEPTVPDQDDQGRYVIHMTAANRFSPATAQVPAGATVVWVNDGGVHDVTAHDDSWSSDDTGNGGLGQKMKPGDEYVHVFADAGDVDYHCALHASTGMKGTLTVA